MVTPSCKVVMHVMMEFPFWINCLAKGNSWTRFHDKILKGIYAHLESCTWQGFNVMKQGTPSKCFTNDNIIVCLLPVSIYFTA